MKATDLVVLFVSIMTGAASIVRFALVLRGSLGSIIESWGHKTRFQLVRFQLPSLAFFVALLPLTVVACALTLATFTIDGLLRFGPSPAHIATTIGAACLALI